MDLYTIILFLHIAGALAFGAGSFMSLFALWSLRRSERVEEVRPVLRLLSLSGPVLGIGMLVNIAAGLYMTADRWSWTTDWISVAMFGVVLYIAAGAVMGIRRNAIQRMVNDMANGSLSENVTQRIHDPVFGTAIYMMLALLFGIVYLMTDKPDLLGSIVTMIVAVVLGGLASFPLWRSEMVEDRSPIPLQQ